MKYPIFAKFMSMSLLLTFPVSPELLVLDGSIQCTDDILLFQGENTKSFHYTSQPVSSTSSFTV